MATTSSTTTTDSYIVKGVDVAGNGYGSVNTSISNPALTYDIPTFGSTAYPVGPVFSSPDWTQFGWETISGYLGAGEVNQMGNNTGGYFGTADCYLLGPGGPVEFSNAPNAAWVTGNGPYGCLFSDAFNNFDPPYTPPTYPPPTPTKSGSASPLRP